MSLAACATTGAEPSPPEPVVVVRTVIEKPPAELLRCPIAPSGLPREGEATIPPAWRKSIIGLARGYREVNGQLGRLIQFHTGEPCPTQGD